MWAITYLGHIATHCIFETCYNGAKTHYCYEIHSTNFDRRKHVHIKMQPPLTGFEPVIFYLYRKAPWPLATEVQCKLSKIIVLHVQLLQDICNTVYHIMRTMWTRLKCGFTRLCHPFIVTSKPHFSFTKTVTPKQSLVVRTKIWHSVHKPTKATDIHIHP